MLGVRKLCESSAHMFYCHLLISSNKETKKHKARSDVEMQKTGDTVQALR